MARLTVGLASAVTFGALSALAGASAVDLLSLTLFGGALLLPIRTTSSKLAPPRTGKEAPPPSARRRRDKSPHQGSFHGAK